MKFVIFTCFSIFKVNALWEDEMQGLLCILMLYAAGGAGIYFAALAVIIWRADPRVYKRNQRASRLLRKLWRGRHTPEEYDELMNLQSRGVIEFFPVARDGKPAMVGRLTDSALEELLS